MNFSKGLFILDVVTAGAEEGMIQTHLPSIILILLLLPHDVKKYLHISLCVCFFFKLQVTSKLEHFSVYGEEQWTFQNM